MGLLDQAIQNHTMWKIKLLGAMSEGRTLDPQSCCSDTQCELGKWLHSENPWSDRAPSQLSQLKQAHEHFHRQVGEVALNVERHEFEKARHSIFQGEFHQGMVNLIQAVDLMKAVQGKEKNKPTISSPKPSEWEMKQARQKVRLAASQSTRRME